MFELSTDYSNIGVRSGQTRDLAKQSDDGIAVR